MILLLTKGSTAADHTCLYCSPGSATNRMVVVPLLGSPRGHDVLSVNTQHSVQQTMRLKDCNW